MQLTERQWALKTALSVTATPCWHSGRNCSLIACLNQSPQTEPFSSVIILRL
jgi:hypothetical protein